MSDTRAIPGTYALKERLVLLFALAALFITGAGLLYYRAYRNSLEADAERLLSSIYKFKYEQVVFWRQDRVKDLASLLDTPVLSMYLENYSADPGDSGLVSLLGKRLELFIKHNDYRGALLLDGAGKVWLSAGAGAHLVPGYKAILARLAAGGGPEISDLALDPASGRAYMDVAASATSGRKGAKLYLFLCADPHDYLYKVLDKWPTGSATGEAQLVRLEGDSVLYISELRHRPDSALKFSLPVSESLPAAQALSGRAGLLRGADYRGREVLAWGGRIEGTGWALLVKMDADELFAGSGRVALLLTLLVAALVGGTGLSVFFSFNLYVRGLALELARSEAEARKQKLNFETLTELANDMFMLADPDTRRLVFVNRKACETYGYTREEMLSAGPEILVAPEHLQRFNERFIEIAGGASGTYESVHVRKDGTRFPMEVSVSSVDLDGKRYVYFICRDITERKQTEARVKESRRQLQSLISNLPGIAYRSLNDQHGTIEFVSAGCLSLTGYTVEELAGAEGLGFTALVLPEDRLPVYEKIQQAVAKKEPYTLSYRLRRKDGGIRYVYEQGAGVWDEKGGLSALEGLITDITELKKAQGALTESEEKFRTIYESSNDAVLLVEGDRCIEANARAVELFGCAGKADLLDTTVREFSPPTQPDGRDSMQAGAEYARAVMEGRTQKFYWKHVRRNGDLIDTEVTLTTVRLRGKTYIMAVMRDITESRRISAALQEKNAELEEFIYTASHDLRTPLVNIQGFADALGRYAREAAELLGKGGTAKAALAGLLRDRVPEAVSFVTSGAVRMDSLIAALLRVARLGRQELAVEELDMDGLVGGLLAAMRFQLEEAGAAVRAGRLPRCRGDQAMISQVFSNLLENAVKYREPGRALNIAISGAAEGGRVVYRVADNGGGLTAEEAGGRVWKLFYRGRPDGPVKGEGIGLTIAKRILERHGGRIAAARMPGGGTEFSVELPAAGNQGETN